jgi:hypothetical protein
LDVEEIDETEEDDRTRFKDQLQTIGSFGRQVCRGRTRIFVIFVVVQTQWSRVILENFVVVQLVMNLNLKVHYCVYKRVPLNPVLSYWIQSILCFLNIHLNIILPLLQF